MTVQTTETWFPSGSAEPTLSPVLPFGVPAELVALPGAEIRGRVVTWGSASAPVEMGYRFTYARDSIPAAEGLPLLRDHDPAQQIGTVDVVPDSDGVIAVLHLGDDVSAEDLPGGLSMGVRHLHGSHDVQTKMASISAAEIEEVSVVPLGAMPDAEITTVTFSAVPNTPESETSNMSDLTGIRDDIAALTTRMDAIASVVDRAPAAPNAARFSADQFAEMDRAIRSNAAGGWHADGDILRAQFAAVTNAAGAGLAFAGLAGDHVVTLADVARAAGAQMTLLGSGQSGLSVSALTPPASPTAAADGAAGTEVAGFAAASVQKGRAWSWTDHSFGSGLSRTAAQMTAGHSLSNAAQVDKVILAALDAVDTPAADIREAILGAAAAAGVPTSRVVVTGPVDEIAPLLATTPTSAQDIAGAFTTIHGALLHVTTGAAAASGVRVFAAPALSLGVSALAAQSVPQPDTGGTRFGSGLWVEAAMNLTTAVRMVGLP